jgi:hypothetical protein
MKTLKIAFVALFATLTMNAQVAVESQVPQSFTEGLLKVYPNAINIEWERSNDNYKVEFINGDLEHTIHFNKKGDRLRVEAEMVKTKLPIALSDAIKKDYSDYSIDSVHSITKNEITTYKVVLHKRDWVEEIILRYSVSGEVLGVNTY